jgi:hypothetical protein
MAAFPLDTLIQLACGARYTSLNANPTTLTGPAIDISFANAVAAGDVTATTPALPAGQYIPVYACHTAPALIASIVDTSATAKRIRTISDAGAAAEATNSLFFFARIGL